MDILGFLRHYPPFDELEPDRLDSVAGSVEIEHVPEGTVVLQQGGTPASHLYVVRKGAVELLDDGRLLDLLGEGEVFGQFSLLAHEGPTVTVRAHEDTLCYLIPEEVADELLETSAGQAFVIGSMRRRILSAAERSFSEGPDPRLSPIGTLVRRAAVTAEPTTAVAAAARRMADERVSSLLVPMRDGWGIVTDRDLRTRVVAVRESFDTPIEAVATFPAMTLEAETAAGEALLRMFADGVHHFPVTDVDGTVTGVVTDTDLMGLTRHSPFAIKSAIERADDLGGGGRGRTRPPAGGGRDGGRQRRSGRRRPGGGARRGHDDRAAAPAGRGGSRRSPLRVGMARPRQRRAPRAGVEDRPGSRAGLRPGRGGSRTRSTPTSPVSPSS